MCIAYIVYYYICLPLCENTHKIIILWVIIILVKICSSICTWLSLQTDYAIQPSLTPLYRGIKNWHNSPAKSGRLIGCTPGPRVIFCAGAFGDSSPSLAFPRREKQGKAFPCSLPGDSSPLRAGASKTTSLRTLFCTGDEVLLTPQGPHVALNEWESGVLCTRQPLMCGWYHVNERVYSTHGSH